jgi:alpha-ketoglutarate-dependent taurine dioxygenase
MHHFHISGNFPLVLSSSNKQHISYSQFLQAIRENIHEVKALLLKHGALLFREFPIHSAKQFSEVVATLGLGKCVDYIGGDSPRDKVEEGIYTSTEAPPNFHIPLHQELSFIKYHPHHIYFFCETPPVTAGETIIADARKVLDAIQLDVKKRFMEKQLIYISHYYYRNKIMNFINRLQRSHKSWTEVFETESKADVEKKCLQNEFQWVWLSHDWLEIKQTAPAIIQHPKTEETVWFNQAHLYDFNPQLLGWKRYLGAKLFYFRKSTRLHEIEHADGSKVARKDLYHILRILENNTVRFPWQRGDVMVLDNILAMHGRAPFSGKRRILTALTSETL